MTMMGVKRGTNAFSSAKQDTNFRDEKAENTGADEFKKAFGDQALGDVANKVADKNYVDPSKKLRAVGNNQMDKDAFFKMMLAQMKHQDPTNPMQSHEMAAQLAQFTSLEQLNNIHQVLGDMAKKQEPVSNYQALNLIGKKISGDSSKLTRTAGDTKHDLNFELMGDAAKATITVKNADGGIVKKVEIGQLKKGANSLEWNGLGDDGMPARPGEYHMSIEARSDTGTKVYAKTSFDGRITGLNYTPEGPILIVGKQTIKLSDVKKIEEAGPMDMNQGQPLGAAAAGGAAAGAAGGISLPGMPPGMTLPPGFKLPNGLSLTPPTSQGAAKAGNKMPNAPGSESGGGAQGASPGSDVLANLTSKPASAPTVQAAATVPAATQASASQQTQAASAQPVAQQEEFIPPAEDYEPQQLAGNINDVPMEQGLLNRLAKETK